MQKELSCSENRWDTIITCIFSPACWTALNLSPNYSRACCVRRLDCAGKLCIEVSATAKMAWISEELCIGCGICVKVSSACMVTHALHACFLFTVRVRIRQDS